MKVGLLALQGAFIEHAQIFEQLGVETVEVRLPGQLEGLAGLIIPGGESTTIGKLAVQYNFIEPIRDFAATKPVWGTCAGLIFLARETDFDQPLLGLMDIIVQRNAFGRQVDSFEADLAVSVFENNSTHPFPAVFIRAPSIIAVRGRAEVIAKLTDGTAVAVQEGKCMGTSFHPELTSDFRFHRYFLNLITGD